MAATFFAGKPRLVERGAEGLVRGQRLRITMLVPTPNLSGGLRVVFTHAARLRLKGHEVNVVTVPPRRPSLREVARSLVRNGSWPRSPSGRVPPRYGGSTECRTIERHRPITDHDVPDADVVVATWWETAEWVAALSPRKGAKVYFIQGDEPSFCEPADRVARTWQLPMHRITCATWLADLVRERTGDDDVHAVPNAVDHDQFHAEPRGKQAIPTVGMLYSTAAVKACDVALEVIAGASRLLPDLDVRAFGMEAPTASMPLPSGARYAQAPAQHAIPRIYSSCDVWLCASRLEGFHLPPLEAMACRCPVVSTNVGGPSELVRNGVNGFLTDVDDVAALTQRLVTVLTLPDEQWRTFSEEAHATATSYRWELAADRFEAALLAAVAKSRRGAAHA